MTSKAKSKRQQTPEKQDPSYQDLKEKLKSLKLKLSEAECESLKEEIARIKILFADTVLSNLASYPSSRTTTAQPSYTAAVVGQNHGDKKAVLVLEKVTGIPATQELNPASLDDILQSAKGGPTVQHLSQKDNRLIMTFNSESDREKARRILQSHEEVKQTVNVLPAPKRSYPVVALYTGKEDLVWLKQELEFRNPTLVGALESVRPLSKNAQHVKIYLNSKTNQAEILRKGSLYLKDIVNGSYSSHMVVEMDINREVRRCYRCQASLWSCCFWLQQRGAVWLLFRQYFLIQMRVIPKREDAQMRQLCRKSPVGTRYMPCATKGSRTI